MIIDETVKKKVAIASAILSSIAILVLIIIFLRIPSAHIYVEVSSRFLSVDVSEANLGLSLPTTGIQLSAISGANLDTNDAFVPSTASQAPMISISTVEVSNLEISLNSANRISTIAGKTTVLNVTAQHISTNMYVSGTGSIEQTQFGRPPYRVELNSEIPERISLKSTTGSLGGLTFFLEHDDALTPQTCKEIAHEIIINPIRTEQIAVANPQLGDSTFQTSLLSGKLLIRETGEKIDLLQGSGLSFLGTEFFLTSMKVSPCGIHAIFTGEVSSLSMRQNGFLSNKMPTVLSYLNMNANIGLITSMILSVWGFLFGLRELLKGGKK